MSINKKIGTIMSIEEEEVVEEDVVAAEVKAMAEKMKGKFHVKDLKKPSKKKVRNMINV